MNNLSNKAFTIVTPNYNMGQYLVETIESVLVNLKPGDEYFIIDGGSTDNSVEIIRRYESQLAGWVTEKDRSYADAIAKGFIQSKNEYQCWINCGDLLLEGALDEARARLLDTDDDMIFGDDLYIDESGKILQVSNGHAKDLAAMMLYAGWTPLQDACFWRSALYEKVGGIDPLKRYAADYDLFLRMSLSGKCKYVPIIFSAFRKHGGQTSRAFAKNYKQERIECRQRELSQNPLKDWRLIITNVYYWFKVRVRVRVFGRKRDMSQLVGKSVANLQRKSYQNMEY